jgi:hypothetical protein
MTSDNTEAPTGTDPSPEAGPSITVTQLRSVFDRLVRAMEEEFGETIVLDGDHYWTVDSSDAFDLEVVPEPVVGQLSDDVSSVTGIETVEIWHDLDHLVGILRRIAALSRPG